MQPDEVGNYVIWFQPPLCGCNHGHALTPPTHIQGICMLHRGSRMNALCIRLLTEFSGTKNGGLQNHYNSTCIARLSAT